MINKDPNHWIQNFNIVGVMQGFNSQYMQRFNKPFYGKLNFLIYDRSIQPELKKLVKTKILLNGYLPMGKKNEFMDEDFYLTPDSLYSIDKLIKELTPLKDKVMLMQIELRKGPDGDTQVVMNKKW